MIDDEARRDRSTEALKLVPRGSVAWFFFERLKHSAEGEIKHQQERDEELYDE